MTASTRTRLTRIAAAGLIVALSQGQAGCAGAATESKPPELTGEQKAAVAVARRTVAGATAKAPDFTVLSVEPRQWSDSSLGCRQRGMSYMQVITDGYVVKLESQGQQHEVHVAGENGVICTGLIAGAPRTPATPRVTNLDAMEKGAIADLAQKLKAEPAEIRVTGRIPQSWDDASLGCSSPAATAHAQSPVAGFKLVLEHRGRLYTYHTDMARVMACPPIEAN